MALNFTGLMNHTYVRAISFGVIDHCGACIGDFKGYLNGTLTDFDLLYLQRSQG